MTATPNEPEFTLKELKDIPVIIAPFELEKIYITNKPTTQVEATARKLILDYLENKIGNAHIFVNSVEFIAKLIKACNLTDANCRAIWSDGNKSYKRSVQGIKRGELHTEAKKINFYTSTCYDGCDILDKEGHYIIISDGAKAHTLVDVATQMTQIVFRIRDTKYKNKAIHIFRETRYSNFVSFEDYKAATEKLKSDAIKLVETYNSVTDETKAKMKELDLNDMYITKENNQFIIDENLITYDLRNYKLAMSTYSSVANLHLEQFTTGFEVENDYSSLEDKETPSEKLKRNENAKTNFKNAFNEYAKIQSEYLDNKFNLISKANSERISYLLEAYPNIKEAYNLLGVKEVKELNYHQTNIKNKLISLSDVGNENKIAKILSGTFNINMWYELDKTKEIIQNAYNQLEIKKTAKATDLKKYYFTEPRTKTVYKNKTVNNEKINVSKERKEGLHIVSSKYIFN